MANSESPNNHGRRSDIEYFFVKTLRQLRVLMNLKSDFDENATKEAIHTNVDFKSANAWTLIFAIVIASAGLNVNSTAVIIGAMLISPLMGPIVGAGFALGVNDYELLQKSFRNLIYAAGISIATSTFFFLISPLGFEQSELLARTQPTFFDVIIAFFGGAAGIVAISRTQRGNAIPGVAIATALMPPLCTAGFGIATGSPAYFLGALYLFVINCVFICVSTYIFVRYLGFQKIKFASKEQQKRTDRWISIVATLVIIPSIFIAWMLQREGLFKSRANAFIEKELRFKRSFVVDKEITTGFRDPKIFVNVLGETLTDLEIEAVKAKLAKYNLPENSLEIAQTVLTEDIEKKLSEKTSSYDTMYTQMQTKLAEKDKELAQFRLADQVQKETAVLFPTLVELNIRTQGEKQLVYVVWRGTPDKTDRDKLNSFLKQRLSADASQIFHAVGIR